MSAPASPDHPGLLALPNSRRSTRRNRLEPSNPSPGFVMLAPLRSAPEKSTPSIHVLAPSTWAGPRISTSTELSLIAASAGSSPSPARRPTAPCSIPGTSTITSEEWGETHSAASVTPAHSSATAKFNPATGDTPRGSAGGKLDILRVALYTTGVPYSIGHPA